MGMPVVMGMVAGLGVGCTRVNVELHSFDVTPLLPLEVHVEVSQVQLGKLPFEG